MQPIEIDTARLRLRQWRDSDLAPFAALCADARAMRFFPSTLDRAASDAAVARWRGQIDDRGWGLWAAERRDTQDFIGFVGLAVPPSTMPFSPCVEIGWRLLPAHWRQGFATEGARAVLRVGFEQLGLDEIVSFTSVLNTPSRSVMERIGMVNAEHPFVHPGIAEGSPLRPHCLYLLSRERWRSLGDAARA